MAPVYAIVVVVLYGWSLMRFLWRLPSFLMYSNMGDIGIVLAYLMTVNLLESLVLICFPVLLCAILPQRWLRDAFVVKGALMVSLGLYCLNYYSSRIDPDLPLPLTLINWLPVILILIIMVSLALGEIKFVSKIVADISDRFVIFLYISIPLSLVSLLVVLVRNIL